MTVESAYTPTSAVADGIIVVFSYAFIINNVLDINVVVDGLTVDPSAYTVDGVLKTVTFNTAPVDLSVVVIARITPLTQGIDYIAGDNFPSDTHEGALDKLTLINQEQTDVVNRALHFPVGDAANPNLPDVPGRRIKFLAFDTAGDIALLGGTGTDPNSVQKPAAAITGNLMEFDSLKDAIDSSILATDILDLLTVININNVINAVNELSLTNAITGSGPSISATGTDTNIPLNLASKGAGDVNINSPSGDISINSTSGDVNINSPSGDVKANGKSVSTREIFILDTPELLATTSTTTGFITHNSLTLGTAGATIAILRFSLETIGINSTGSVYGHVRKTGSGITDPDITKIVQAGHSDATNTYASSTNTTHVNLDTNSDFDYYGAFVGGLTTSELKIYLVGYYV